MKRASDDEKRLSYIDILESNLTDIAAPFKTHLSATFRKLTPTEIEIANLVAQGRTTKDIAGMLSIETGTVDFHRNNIRKKIGINKSKTNLRSYLSSLT